MHSGLVTLIDEIKRKTEFCRDWRNRRFAHRDLTLAMQDAASQRTHPVKAAETVV